MSDWFRQNWFFVFVGVSVVLLHTEYGRGGIGHGRPDGEGLKDETSTGDRKEA